MTCKNSVTLATFHYSYSINSFYIPLANTNLTQVPQPLYPPLSLTPNLQALQKILTFVQHTQETLSTTEIPHASDIRTNNLSCFDEKLYQLVVSRTVELDGGRKQGCGFRLLVGS